jgi:DNA-binding MarR family transcriptional regulator
MLSRVLVEIEAANGVILVPELSRKLDIDSAALEGMLTFLERKGRLRRQDIAQEARSSVCVRCALSRFGCSATCSTRE